MSDEPKADYSFLFEEPGEGTSLNDPRGGPIVLNLRRASTHPGEWARIVAYPNGRAASLTVHKLRTGTMAARRPPGTWEFERREVDGQFVIYARLVEPAAE